MKLQLLKQKINYRELVEGIDLDLETYNKKFEMWDYVVANKLEGTQEAFLILNDPTIWAYANFQNDKWEAFKLAAFQDAVINVANDYNFNPFHPSRHITMRAANQTGKSGMDAIFACYWFLNGENECIVIVANNLDNSKRVLRESKFLLNTSV